MADEEKTLTEDRTEFPLLPVLDKVSETFKIKDYDAVLEACNAFIAKTTDGLNLEDLSKEMYDCVRNSRKPIRKNIDKIKRVRIDCNKLALDTFNSQAKQLENILQEVDLKLKAYVDKYELEVLNKQPKPATITLTVKGTDMKKIEKVKEFAVKQGLEVAIK